MRETGKSLENVAARTERVSMHLRPLRVLEAPTLATVPTERTLMLDACRCSEPDVVG